MLRANKILLVLMGGGVALWSSRPSAECRELARAMSRMPPRSAARPARGLVTAPADTGAAEPGALPPGAIPRGTAARGAAALPASCAAASAASTASAGPDKCTATA